MSVELPDWYPGGWPDLELVMMDLCQRWLNELTPQGEACTWLPKNLGQLLDEGRILARVYRGGLGSDGLFDAAAMQVAVFGPTRADSWRVAGYLRQMVLSYRRGGEVRHQDGSSTWVTYVEEMTGPQQIPELNPDYRLVPITFRVETRLPRTVPDYALIRESQPL